MNKNKIMLVEDEGIAAQALDIKEKLDTRATGGSAIWRNTASGELCNELDLSPPGGLPVKAALYRPQHVSGDQQKEAAEKLGVQDVRPSGVRILLMDDEAAVLEIAIEFLQYVGYRVDGVGNGDEAIRAYQRAAQSGDPYRAVILDLYINAGMGGKEAMERLRELDPQVKAIISSGNASDPLITHYAAHGFAAILLKPYRLGHLQKTLASLL